MTTFGLCLLAYLCGSVPFAKLISRRHGLDIQRVGSGNIGFANVWRQLGWRPALPVLLGDALKGFLPVWLAQSLNASLHVQMLVGFLAIIGHCFPAWLRFRGGKGIATGLGVGLALAPLQIAACAFVYLLIVLVWRRSALGSLVSAWSLALACLLTKPELAGYFAALAVFAMLTHRNNLKNAWKILHAR
ncbi:MAG TPA: glycerol-3-phosphate 1-O-acyltransferase PlsY [Candidatus Saccharimonadales bacterium]|nr:glycerol-3-phosphate 1-O-acyltransferase PlsY [Candidatus Saccharimonadales bacterium]